jgi:membrane dipeptidase
MDYMESDPLLPKGRPAPEIQGSRPQSMSDAEDREAPAWNTRSDGRRPRRFGHILGLMWIMLVLVVFVFLVEPDGFKMIWGDGPWTPRTIDERVKSILTKTPLIGWL